MSRKEYFFLNHQGECLKPDKNEVGISDLTNMPYMLIPDNNVCTHVSDFHGYKDKNKIIKAENFLNYASESEITVNPTWGLLEKASKPGTLNLDIDELDSYENAFWRKLNCYIGNQTISSCLRSESLDEFKRKLYPLYAYLLKIKLILQKRGASSKNAKSNLNELYDFTNEINIYLLTPWQVALAIFGGNNQLEGFIKPRKGQDIFQAIWGAAWDLFHLQISHEYNGTRRIKNIYPQYIFATDDKRCATIGQTLKVVSVLNYGDTIYNITSISYDFPHWKQKESFILDTYLEIFKKTTERVNRRNQFSEQDRQHEIETIVNNSSSQILKITKELKTITKKGFG